MTLEICAYNIQSCRVAEKAGAHRIEFCADPMQGGTTPGFGSIVYALEQISIPVFPMIRPRGGNFVYDQDEIAIMKKDIIACKQLGCLGIATGVQLPGGRINTTQLKRFVEWAYPMAVTCHKVFDTAPDPFQALEDVIETGCTRILTSGSKKTAMEGSGILSKLIAQSAGRILIMPGGGVRSGNLAQLMRQTGAIEYHSSGLLSDSDNHIADRNEVGKMANLLG